MNMKSALIRRLSSLFVLIIVFSIPAFGWTAGAVGNTESTSVTDRSSIVDGANLLSAIQSVAVSFGNPHNADYPIPLGTRIIGSLEDSDVLVVDFSREILGDGLTEDRLTALFDCVRLALPRYGINGDVRLLVDGRPITDFLPAAQKVGSVEQTPLLAVHTDGKLAGHSVTISPGHGVYWTGSSWDTQRPVYGYPLNEEDFHTLEICQYLEKYLQNEGLSIKTVRCTDKSFGSHYSGYPWWKMASCYWLKNEGYPRSVYGSYDDTELGVGSQDMSNDIRARPLASDYDNTDIYVSVHTNGLNGDVAHGGPSGTQTYYDASSEHSQWGTASKDLATKISNAVIGSIDANYDATWTSNGQAVRDSAGAYGEIRIPSRPAILLELAFHDTDDRDAVYLRDNFFRSTAMWGMYKGICDYFGVTPTWGFYSCEYVSDTIPAFMTPGQQCQAAVTLRNRGVLWTEARQIRLGAVGDSDPFSGQTRQYITGEVGPNDTYTFNLSLTAPSTPGSYTTDWQMVREGTTWFGPVVSKTINVGDSVSPSLTISSPTHGCWWSTGSSSISIGGSASDNTGIANVQWTNNRGGSGTCSGTNEWSANIPLQPGRNIICVAATDLGKNCTTASLTVFYSTSGQSVRLAGVTTKGSILFSSDLSTWNQAPGALSQVVVGDFDGDGKYDLAGIAGDGGMWFTTDEAKWTKIPGCLKSLTVGDFNADGKDDLSGLSSDGSIWYTIDLQHWSSVPGRLAFLAAADLVGNGQDGFVGLTQGGSIWYTIDFKTWTQIPGYLGQIAVGDFNGDRMADVAGLSNDGSIWYTTDLRTWTKVPGYLKKLVSGDWSGIGRSGLAGISSDGSIWYTTDETNWNKVSGVLSSLMGSDLNSDGKQDLAGLTSNGNAWYTSDLHNWMNMPGSFTNISAAKP